jgi:hypothetical protein
MSDDVDFELEPYNNQAQRGLAGSLGRYGQVRVFYAKPIQRQPSAPCRTEVVGEQLPETTLTGPGSGGKPHLSRQAVLSVGGTTAELVYNARAFRRTARALHIGLGDREYLYSSAGSDDFVLRRGTVQMMSRAGGWVVSKGARRHLSVHGPADETDLAVALVFEKVDVSPLSISGVLWNAPVRILSPRADGGGE